ncbi:S8 family peptidase [Portibacter lacus]|uniref:S8 family peptidase n=1 Tax=Portibacter lacus TaxID=1099794 RepID=UPI001F313A3C|nr:S8 family peptidase [Portibacter lacus]
MYEFYLFSLISSLILLVLWQTLGKSKVLRRFFGTLFLFAFITYAFSLFQLHLRDFYSLKIVFRDLMLLSFASFTSILARKTKLGILSWILLSGFLAFLLQKNKDILIPKDFNLDEQAELIIKLNSPVENINNTSFLAFLEKENIKITRSFSLVDDSASELDNYYSIDLEKSDIFHLTEIKKSLRSFDFISVIEENEEINLAPLEVLAPAEEIQNGFSDPLSAQQWALTALKVNELNELIKNQGSNKKAKLFILDTGIDAEHEDLKGNYLSLKKKYDTDVQSHGTHCAGIAGAISNNETGVASLNVNNNLFTITAIKVLNDYGMGTQKTIIDGIIEAAENEADVISLSLGGRSTDKRQKLYEEAVAYANKAGAIVVVAAGNSSMNAKGYSPANTPGVIAVAAIDQNLNIAPFSNTVEDLGMGIAAPGVQILSTTPNNEYKAFNGTSMATPYVAGLVAIMKSYHPELSTAEVYELLNLNGQFVAQNDKSGNLIDPVKTIKNLLGN